MDFLLGVQLHYAINQRKKRRQKKNQNPVITPGFDFYPIMTDYKVEKKNRFPKQQKRI